MDDVRTPMLRQYQTIKAQHPHAILMFRLGDFYEMFYDDALLASKTLSLTLTARGRGTPNEAPMCGVPFHAAEGYIARLIREGFRVAICDQVEDPRTARGIVRRAVTRVISPGTVTDEQQLEASSPNYIAALWPAGDPARAGPPRRADRLLRAARDRPSRGDPARHPPAAGHPRRTAGHSRPLLGLRARRRLPGAARAARDRLASGVRVRRARPGDRRRGRPPPLPARDAEGRPQARHPRLLARRKRRDGARRHHAPHAGAG